MNRTRTNLAQHDILILLWDSNISKNNTFFWHLGAFTVNIRISQWIIKYSQSQHRYSTFKENELIHIVVLAWRKHLDCGKNWIQVSSSKRNLNAWKCRYRQHPSPNPTHIMAEIKINQSAGSLNSIDLCGEACGKKTVSPFQLDKTKTAFNSHRFESAIQIPRRTFTSSLLLFNSHASLAVLDSDLDAVDSGIFMRSSCALRKKPESSSSHNLDASFKQEQQYESVSSL